MKFIFLILLSGLGGLSAFALPTPSPTEIRSTVHKLVDDFKGKNSFNTRGCPRITPNQWLKLLFTGESIHQEFHFEKDCDLQGSVDIKNSPFPVDLAVRNVPDAKRIKGIVEPKIDPDLLEQVIQVRITIKQGLVTQASELMSFTADYPITTGLDGKIVKNAGGKVQVSRFKGSKVNISEPIHFDSK